MPMGETEMIIKQLQYSSSNVDCSTNPFNYRLQYTMPHTVSLGIEQGCIKCDSVNRQSSIINYQLSILNHATVKMHRLLSQASYQASRVSQALWLLGELNDSS